MGAKHLKIIWYDYQKSHAQHCYNKFLFLCKILSCHTDELNKETQEETNHESNINKESSNTHAIFVVFIS